MYSVQKNVPLPERAWRGRGGSPQIYPFDQMEIGDCFFAPDKNRSQVSVAVRNYVNKHPETYFAVRSTDKGPGCWRLR